MDLNVADDAQLHFEERNKAHLQPELYQIDSTEYTLQAGSFPIRSLLQLMLVARPFYSLNQDLLAAIILFQNQDNV